MQGINVLKGKICQDLTSVLHPYRDGLFEKITTRPPTRKVTDNARLAFKL